MAEADVTTLKSKVRASGDVLFQELAGEAVLLHLKTGNYSGLDAVGTRMWQVLTQSSNVEDAYGALLKEFDVSRERLQTDLLHFINELAARQLLEIDPA